MTMRTHTLFTHLRPEEAYTLIEFLEQVRASLLHTYGEDIRTMLQEASSQQTAQTLDEDPF